MASSPPPSTVPSNARATPAVHLALIAVQLCFASFSTVAKIALRQVPFVGLAAVRVTAAAAIFVVIWAIVEGRRPERPDPIGRADVLRCALYAFFGVTANQLLFIAGLSRTSATNGVVLGASIPVFTVGVALLMGREKSTPLKFAGLAVALAGALGITGASRFEMGSHAVFGNVLILVNSMSFSIYLVISRDVLSRVRPLTVVTLTFVFGAIGIDAYLFLARAIGLLPFDPVAFFVGLPGLDRATWLAMGHIILLPTVGAYLLNTLALRVVPASVVAIYIYLQPVAGSILAAVVLGERPGTLTFLGAGLIFAGVWLVSLDSRRMRRARATQTVE